MDAYVKMFLKATLDCYDPVGEDILVDVCRHVMIEDYKIYVENLSFSSFFKLMEARTHMNEIRQKDLKV